MKGRRRQKGKQRGRQQERRDRQVEPGHASKDYDRGQSRNEELGQVAAEIDFQMFHAIDQRDDHLTGAG